MILSLRMALRSIGANKLRAALTMLGIIIGVMALVVLVSLVTGATSSVTDAVSSLGSDLITVNVLDDKGAPVRLSDLEQWADEEPAIGSIAPLASSTATGKNGSDSGSVTLYGTTAVYYDIKDLHLTLGRFLRSSDVANSARVCVLNDTAADELMGYTDCIGEEVSLDGIKYTVVGVLEADESMTSLLTAGRMCAYIPYTSLIRVSGTVTDRITTFYMAAPADGTVEAAEDAMDAILLERFDEDEDAYSISSTNILEEAMSSITSVLSILLGGIAGISLIVGGIGIMNIMLVTVTERTREIGIRKAIGATRGTILRQFLLEAVILCMMGCGIGIFASWGILRIISVVVSGVGLSFHLQTGVVLISVAFCFVIGVIFGLYPANKAARMKPIDALHYGG